MALDGISRGINAINTLRAGADGMEALNKPEGQNLSLMQKLDVMRNTLVSGFGVMLPTHGTPVSFANNAYNMYNQYQAGQYSDMASTSVDLLADGLQMFPKTSAPGLAIAGGKIVFDSFKYCAQNPEAFAKFQVDERFMDYY